MVHEHDSSSGGAAFLDGLLTRMGIDAQSAGVEDHEGTILLSLEGDVDAVSRDGELRDALGMLTSRAASRESGERIHCQIDIGGRWRRRHALLKDAAAELADYVARTGRVAVVESLSSTERRIVHTTVVDDERVDTRSDGEAGRRVLLIGPSGD